MDSYGVSIKNHSSLKKDTAMRTNIFTSTLLIAIFCCFFSITAQAQFGKKILKTLDKTTTTINKAKEISNKVENAKQVVNEWTGEGEEEEETSDPETEAQGQTSPTQQSAPENKEPTVSKPSKSTKGSLPANNPLEGYTVKVLNCIGNSGTQSIKVTFTVYHELPEQALTIQADYTKAFSNGIEYKRSKRRVGSSNSVTGRVPNKTLLQCTVEFQNITDDVKTLDKVMIGLRSYNRVGRDNAKKGTLEMKNVSINWN